MFGTPKKPQFLQPDKGHPSSCFDQTTSIIFSESPNMLAIISHEVSSLLRGNRGIQGGHPNKTSCHVCKPYGSFFPKRGPATFKMGP